MAKIPGSIPVAGPIAPTDVSDTHGTHYSNFGVGGVHHAATLAERDAIPAERREEGMLCTVADANGGGVPCTFQLVGGKSNACWQAFATGSGGGGAPGAPGKDGKDGVDGKDGADGKSAYELAVQRGFQGSEEDYLTSISKIQLAEPALDWANVVDVTAAVTTEGNYTVRQFTAPVDGLVVFACTGASKSISQASSATGLVISVNGYTTQAGNIHRSASTMALSQRVSEGDVVRCMFITGDAAFNSLKLVPVKASNALLRTYSTTEADTGKVWIDGKPIYRIALETTTASKTGAWNVLATVPDVDHVVALSGVFRTSNGYSIPLNYYASSSSSIALAYNHAASTLVEHHSNSSYGNAPIRVIFEYTKV